MDLGINGKSALVCAASKGLGRACAVSLAREGVNLTINNLLPGPFATDRLKGTVESVAAASERRFEEVWEQRMKANPAGRFGDPAEFGEACACLSGGQAGFITGQNLLLDGGAFPGTL